MIFSPSGKALDFTCNEQLIPEFPDMLFGGNTDESYFNPLPYLQKNNLDIDELQKFGTAYVHQILSLSAVYNIRQEDICRLDKSGNIVIHSAFLYLFVSYLSPVFLAWTIERVDELISNGFCVSDSYLCKNAVNRIPQQTITSLYQENGTTGT